MSLLMVFLSSFPAWEPNSWQRSFHHTRSVGMFVFFKQFIFEVVVVVADLLEIVFVDLGDFEFVGEFQEKMEICIFILFAVELVFKSIDALVDVSFVAEHINTVVFKELTIIVLYHSSSLDALVCFPVEVVVGAGHQLRLDFLYVVGAEHHLASDFLRIDKVFEELDVLFLLAQFLHVGKADGII